MTDSTVARLHRKAGADRWGIDAARFRAVLESSATRGFGDRRPAEHEVERHLASLHLADLALAAACADGNDAAWEHFVREHRPALYRAADALDPSGGARDLADTLYGDLFGTREREGARQSLFRYFHGRSSLATWLRAVLAQRHVDRVRLRRKLTPLPDDDEAQTALPERAFEPPNPERPRFLAMMQRVLAAAIAALDPRDRLRMACYYARDMKLAAIGRMLREHEATVSRHLTRTRALIRDDVERRLREEGLDDRAIAECFESVVADAGPLALDDWLGPAPAAGPAGKNPLLDRSR